MVGFRYDSKDILIRAKELCLENIVLIRIAGIESLQKVLFKVQFGLGFSCEV